MDRRLFTRIVASLAGSAGLVQAGAQETAEAAEPANEKSAGKKPGARGPKVEAPDRAGELDEHESPAVNVEDFKALAKARLPAATFDYITTGSADEITLRENVAAFQRLKILPPVLADVSAVDTSTTVLKQRVSLPVLLAPVAAQAMYHAEGALASARAAAAAGTIFGVSGIAGHSVEAIAAASEGPKWYQLYAPRDRAVARRLVERAETAGYRAIVLTVDLGEWKDADRRNRFALPKEMLAQRMRDLGFTGIAEGASYQEMLDFDLKAWQHSLSWEYFDWLRSISKLPLLVKGVLRSEDAKKAVSIGLDGIIVSNHGGRRLDGVPASIDVLPDIVAAVDGRAEVFLDSGIRRGTDVLKALALGAKAVLIGRPYAWALAADGETGVRNVIELFRQEFELAMFATGCARIGDIRRSLIVA